MWRISSFQVPIPFSHLLIWYPNRGKSNHSFPSFLSSISFDPNKELGLRNVCHSQTWRANIFFGFNVVSFSRPFSKEQKKFIKSFWVCVYMSINIAPSQVHNLGWNLISNTNFCEIEYSVHCSDHIFLFIYVGVGFAG